MSNPKFTLPLCFLPQEIQENYLQRVIGFYENQGRETPTEVSDQPANKEGANQAQQARPQCICQAVDLIRSQGAISNCCRQT